MRASIGLSHERLVFVLELKALNLVYMTKNVAIEEAGDAWLKVLVQGGDERIELKEESGNRNRYNLNPLDSQALFYRGSCTCGVLSEDTLMVMEANKTRFNDAGSDAAWADEQRTRIQAVLDPNDRSEVFFGPSGTDLLYYPLLVARAQSKRPVLNILSCPEELGSGSRMAVVGRGFSLKTASQTPQAKGALLHNDLESEVIELPARSEEGVICDRKADIKALIGAHQDKTVIVHLVFGSKSGIKDDLDVIEPLPNVIWTVDLCQFRANPELVDALLSKGAMVLITGSKFYQAPPFCGALLVPKAQAEHIGMQPPEAVKGLANILVKNDIPTHFGAFRNCLPIEENRSSRMRWECGLFEMEMCHDLSREKIDRAIFEWNAVVSAAIEKTPELEMMPDQSETNDSIISFRIRSAEGHFDGAAIKQLFGLLTLGNWQAELGHERLFVGQPVCYGEKWFLRVALGSRCARIAAASGSSWATDERMVELIANTAKKIES